MNPPHIIELVGIAGAGKTTLANALSKSNQRIKLIDHPYFRDPKDIPFFMWHTLLMLPFLIRIYISKGIKSITLREVAWMVILNGWHRVLRKRTRTKNCFIVMDQGPVSIMAELHYIDPARNRTRFIKKWWEKIFKAWRGTLDLLVLLDATDTELVNRVRTRKKWHLIKYKEDQDATEFNLIYRSIYNKLVGELTTGPTCPSVIRFDTGEKSTEELKEKVLIEIGLMPGNTAAKIIG